MGHNAQRGFKASRNGLRQISREAASIVRAKFLTMSKLGFSRRLQRQIFRFRHLSVGFWHSLRFKASQLSSVLLSTKSPGLEKT